MTIKQNRLLLVIVPVMIVLIYGCTQLFSLYFSIFSGLFAYSLMYWVLCLLVCLLFLTQDDLKTILTSAKTSIIRRILFTILAFLPAILIIVTALPTLLSDVTIKVVTLALMMAFVNSIIEELFWRGLFAVKFKDNIWAGYVIPTLLFTLHHVTLAFYGGAEYTGGPYPIIISALIMGSIWGIVAYKQKSILMTMLAHFIVNSISFSALLLDNIF